MKEKVKSVPKELVRRGLDDETERLRGQFRDTAQRGQASDYGGDRIEDTAAGGARRAKRGAERSIEAFLKKKKKGKNRMPDEVPRTITDPPTPQEPPSDTPPQGPPRIKTREAVAARESSMIPSDSGGAGSTPATGSERQRVKIRESTVRDTHTDTSLTPQDKADPPRIRTRESAVHDVPAGGEPVTQSGGDPPRIKIKNAVTGTPSDHKATTTQANGKGLPIKTKDAYIQRQPTTPPERPSQAFTQGRQEFVQEQGRRSVAKQASIQRTGNSAVPKVRGGGDVSPSAPARQGYAAGGRRYAPARPAHQTVSTGSPDIRSVQEGGKNIIKTARPVKKAPERTARHAIKTAERSSQKAIKTTQRTAKTAQQTVKAAQTTTKATQRAAQAARATAQAAATTARATAKAAAAAAKAAMAAMQALAAVIAGASLPVLLVVVVICLVGLIAASPFGIFFGIFFPSGGGDSANTVSPSAVIAEISSEYADRLSALQAEDGHDSVEILGGPPAWANVLAVFSAKTTAGADGSAAVLDTDNTEQLKTVFWDMTKITTGTRTVDHPAVGDTAAWTETVLTITVTPRTPDDMRVFYSFTETQNKALDDLLAEENSAMWQDLLYGNSSGIVAVALSQVGNVGGQPYWSWFGFTSRVEWCACFVSWCANECGYIDAGVIPKTAGCVTGSDWFKARGQWQDNSYEPHPGDIIYFDWDNKGSSGPQDGVPDHVGIVERVEDGVVYTVEGNSSDSCRQRSYSVGHYEVYGYGTPTY